MPVTTIEQARRALEADLAAAQAKAKKQQDSLRAGYTRSAGFEPAQRTPTPYVAEANRPQASGPVPGTATKDYEPDPERAKRPSRKYGLGEGDQQ